MTALALASVRRLVRRLARMYGISGHAATAAAPARGLMHSVIIRAEHSGQSVGCDGS